MGLLPPFISVATLPLGVSLALLVSALPLGPASAPSAAKPGPRLTCALIGQSLEPFAVPASALWLPLEPEPLAAPASALWLPLEPEPLAVKPAWGWAAPRR